MKGDSELAALVVAVDGDAEFEIDVGVVLGRFRKRRERAIRDMEAARLLPTGAARLAKKRGNVPSTIYRSAERGRTLLRELQHDATKS